MGFGEGDHNRNLLPTVLDSRQSELKLLETFLVQTCSSLMGLQLWP